VGHAIIGMVMPSLIGIFVFSAGLFDGRWLDHKEYINWYEAQR